MGFFLLVTRCQQFAHIFCLRRYYCIADVCSTQDYADEVAAKLYSENCFVCCSCPEQQAPLDHFIVQHLTPEINLDANDRRIQDTNATLISLCVLCPKFRLFYPAVKQGIYAAHMLWVNKLQYTDMSRKSRRICQRQIIDENGKLQLVRQPVINIIHKVPGTCSVLYLNGL